MEILRDIVDIFLHLDKHLTDIVTDYGFWTYLILFMVIFVETGLVIMPFLPGDSLLFAAGAIAGLGALNIFYLIILLFIAAFLGDTLNYFIGNYIGPKVFRKDYKLLKRDHLYKTQDFYNKYGGKTIIIARFIPIIRTFAPFIAGVGTMNYAKFISYNIIGGILWVVGFLALGYVVGNDPIVKKNFSFVILGIIVISLLPPVIEYIRMKFFKKPTV